MLFKTSLRVLAEVCSFIIAKQVQAVGFVRLVLFWEKASCYMSM